MLHAQPHTACDLRQGCDTPDALVLGLGLTCLAQGQKASSKWVGPEISKTSPQPVCHRCQPMERYRQSFSLAAFDEDEREPVTPVGLPKNPNPPGVPQEPHGSTYSWWFILGGRRGGGAQWGGGEGFCLRLLGGLPLGLLCCCLVAWLAIFRRCAVLVMGWAPSAYAGWCWRNQ